jgi:tyrosine-specific transport protein
MMTQKGSLFGGTLLVAGCSIGAGMLGIPVVSSLVGFFPSLLLSTLSWIYMCTTGLLLLEVNLSFKEDVSLISISQKYLGSFGKILTWGLFLYLFYSLLVAYISGTASLVSDFSNDFFGVSLSPIKATLPILFLFGVLIFLGTFFVDECNRLLMIGLFATYFTLLFFGLPKINPSYLTKVDFSASQAVLSLMVIMFGYHNLVPTLTTYLNHDVKKLKLTIILGSLIPLVIYLLWQLLILGLVPNSNETLSQVLKNGDMATKTLRLAVGKAFITDTAEAFAFFAIMTSLLSIALSFVDFLSDGLHIKKTPKGKLFLISLVLLPPFLFSMTYPSLFLIALEYAGAFGAVTLFGILPAIAVFVKRFKQQDKRHILVPGGYFSLFLVIAFSFLVMGLLIKQELF